MPELTQPDPTALAVLALQLTPYDDHDGGTAADDAAITSSLSIVCDHASSVSVVICQPQNH
jgi:hypothetical protein